DHTGNEHIAVLLGAAEQVQVPHVEEVEPPCCVSDPHADLLVPLVGVAESPIIGEAYIAKAKKGRKRTSWPVWIRRSVLDGCGMWQGLNIDVQVGPGVPP